MVCSSFYKTISAIHDMANRPFIFHSQLARHRRTLSKRAQHVNSHLRPLFDPFLLLWEIVKSVKSHRMIAGVGIQVRPGANNACAAEARPAERFQNNQ